MECVGLVGMSSLASNTKCSLLPSPTKTKLGWISEKGKHYARKRLVSGHSLRIRSESNEGGLDIDRRRLLLSSSTLGLSALTAGKSLAQSFPAPDFSKCSLATVPSNNVYSNECCPPYSSTTQITDFVFPTVVSPRTRMPAHLVDDAYIKKYNLAVQKMRELDVTDPDDPRGFTQQAKIHCAYCNGAYLVGANERNYNVHTTWFFAPFHRWYIYFYERILGKLIDDDTFALPFWNWDTEEGMVIPSMFTKNGSALYDENRNSCHQPPVIINLDEAKSCDSGSVSSNYSTIYSHMVSGAKTTEAFHGRVYRFESLNDETSSNSTDGAGSLEMSPHNLIHVWAGSSTTANGEDMGQLYSSGRDPLFYCHHVNVDRMWHVWNSRLEGKNYTDSDLLDSEFLFYDENKNLVRVKAGDSYDINKLGYEYQEVDLPWLNQGRSLKKAGTLKTKPAVRSFRESPNQPTVLTAPVTVRVKRPTQKRSTKEKEDAEEILVVDGIEFDMAETSKFNVYINLPDAKVGVGANSPHYAGTFSHLGHGKDTMSTMKKSMKKKNRFKVGITETLEDINAEEDETITVTLVPQAPKFLPKTPIKFSSIKIVFDNK